MTPNEAQKHYHWVKYDSTTNTIELYLDNYMLSGARQCEAKFYLDHMLNISPRYDTSRRKPWFFDFGEFVHYCLEDFYKYWKLHHTPPDFTWWLDRCKEQWLLMAMD